MPEDIRAIAAKKRKRVNFLYISIIVHILLGLLAAYIIVQVITPRSKPKFTEAPPSQMAVHPDEHKVKQEKRNSTMSAPAIKRITANMPANITLPPMPDVPTLNNTMSAGNTVGAGMGIGVGTGTGPGDGGPHVFGAREPIGIPGQFDDFQHNQNNKFTGIGPNNFPAYTRIVRAFLGSWQVTNQFPHYHSPTTLYAKYFFVPWISSLNAGQAFQAPTAPNGNWIAHYTGSFVSPKSGTFRFIGFGDNMLVVRLNQNLVLDASNQGFWVTNKQAHQSLNVHWADIPAGMPGSGQHGKPLFAGTWFSLTQGMTYNIEVAMGDEGGEVAIGLLIEEQGQKYDGKNPMGFPDYPLFLLGPLTDKEKTALGRYFSPESMNGPIFQYKKNTFNFAPF